MALLGNFDDDYTRTGHGLLTRIANAASFIPLVGPVINTTVGYLGTALESASWLFKGEFGSAVTVAASGLVGNTVNAAVSTFGTPFFWQLGSGVATGTSVGTHARKGTEAAIGAVTGALGFKPTVLRSYTAGIGSGPGGSIPAAPGKFATAEANRRGQNANTMYQNYMRGEGGVNVAELGSANAGRA